MAKIVACKLTYFNIKGKGEPIRLACNYAGLPLEDVRVSREEFQAMREAKEIPFNQLPVAEFFDDEGRSVCKVAQTRAILRTVARASGDKLYSSDLGQAASIDSFLDFEEDLFAAMRSSIFPGRIGMDEYKDDAEKEARRAHVAETVFKAGAAGQGPLRLADGLGGGNGRAQHRGLCADRIPWLDRLWDRGRRPTGFRGGQVS